MATTTKKTRFDTVEIRHYPCVLSDNPGGMYGPPIELGWEYNAHPGDSINNGSEKNVQNILRLSAYEKERHGKRRKSLYLSHVQRESMLRDANYTEKELKRAIQRKNCARRKRSMSNFLTYLHPVTKIQSKIHNGRRVKKLRKAKKNLQKMNEGHNLFYEHSEIYQGWWIPMSSR
mmetsp:Transcript_7083/g.12697  ORF Transcript_7083/g.12697 Transcript_7083/m.12697 type:complete len:175 (+) Transcript_7083:117-641(+)